MTARSKGNRNRRACITLLEKQGFLVDVVEKTGRFVKVKDLFGLFDLIAIKKGMIMLVQVSTNKVHNHQRLQDFKNKYNHIMVRQYKYVDRKGFVVYDYEIDGKWSKEKTKG